MPVPTALATNIRYKGVDYPFGTPITITELHPTLEITFDVNDFNGARLSYHNGLGDGIGAKLRESKGTATVVSSLVLRENLHFDETFNVISIYPFNTDGEGVGRSWVLTVDLADGTSDSWQYLASTILRDTLIANLTAGELAVITQSSIIKIFWEGVDNEYTQPYIVTQTITGGDLNSSQVAYAEMLWRVIIHTPSLAIAGQMENAIHKALARKDPVINFSGVSSAGEIEEVTPVSDRYQVQNVPMYVSGGIYRIRLSKG